LPHDFEIPERNFLRNRNNKTDQEKRTLNCTSIVEEEVVTNKKNKNNHASGNF
jgi:hypothetical protein